MDGESTPSQVNQTVYPETEAVALKRHNCFTYHPPKGDQAERYTTIRSAANEVAATFNEFCPQSRELSLAMTNLEQAVFWANAAIARNE